MLDGRTTRRGPTKNTDYYVKLTQQQQQHGLALDESTPPSNRHFNTNVNHV